MVTRSEYAVKPPPLTRVATKLSINGHTMPWYLARWNGLEVVRLDEPRDHALLHHDEQDLRLQLGGVTPQGTTLHDMIIKRSATSESYNNKVAQHTARHATLRRKCYLLRVLRTCEGYISCNIS